MGTRLAGGIDGVRKGGSSLQGEPDLLASHLDLSGVKGTGVENVAEPGGQRFRDSTELTVVGGIDSYHHPPTRRHRRGIEEPRGAGPLLGGHGR